MGQVSYLWEQQRKSWWGAPVFGLAYVPGVKPLRCAIVCHTREGACVSSSVALPNVFILRPADSAIERICRVTWRDSELLGVQYVNARTMGRSRKKASALVPADMSNVIALYPT